MKPLEDIYDGKDPRDVPSYRAGEAARYLALSPSTLRAWFFGQRGFHPVIRPADAGNGLLSFRNLVEAHVLSTLRVHHQIPLPKIRKAVKYLAKLTGSDRPLSDIPVKTDGVSLFLQASQDVLNVTRQGQLELGGIVEAYLARVASDSIGPISLYPFTRKREAVVLSTLQSDPRIVVIDPRYSFGRPVLAKTTIRTAVIAQRYLAGESIESLAQDYGRSALEIEEAIRSEVPAAA